MLNLDTLLADLITNAEKIPRDLAELLPRGKRHPMDRPLGPLKPRGNPSGLVVQAGETLASFGDIETPEVTFSCAKSYLSALTGIALRDGLITDLDEPVGKKVKDGGFDNPQNASITWTHLLQQTSEWEGELFGLPDWLDRGRTVGGGADGAASNPGDGTVGGTATGHRTLQTPGSFWEYNDVRVNRLSLALLRLFQEPLPDVLKREIMDPLGASGTWEWHGYETSTVDVAGRPITSVSGGTHWGGGLWINTKDHAKFGALYLGKGRAGGKEILPQEWIAKSLTPCSLNKGYGYLFWLNDKGALSKKASPKAFAAKGAGGHTVFVEPEKDLVITLRWITDGTQAVDRILTAL